MTKSLPEHLAVLWEAAQETGVDYLFRRNQH